MLNKQDILNVIENWDMKELVDLRNSIDSLIAKDSKEVQINLSYNYYKGSGKAWISKIDKDTRKILDFVNVESNIKDGYKGTKVFKLTENGCYLLNFEGSKSRDRKMYIQFLDGKFYDIDDADLENEIDIKKEIEDI